MKSGIHPKTFETKVNCNGCNTAFTTISTVEAITVEICSNCHPFYTGKQKLVDTAGRLAIDAQMMVYQDSATGTCAVVDLVQEDVSEEFINFRSAVGASQPIDTAALGTYYGKIRVSVNGTFKFMALYNS